MGEDVVGVGVPGTPHKGGLDNLLERLWQSPEEFQLLENMKRTIQPVIISLKDIKVLFITGSALCLSPGVGR